MQAFSQRTFSQRRTSTERVFPHTEASQSKRFTCEWVFTGFDLELHEAFQLVPRLQGLEGCHVRVISEVSGGKVHIPGRVYQKGKVGYGEAKAPLEILLSCGTEDGLVEGVPLLEMLLMEIRQHILKFCRKKKLPVTELYQRVN